MHRVHHYTIARHHEHTSSTVVSRLRRRRLGRHGPWGGRGTAKGQRSVPAGRHRVHQQVRQHRRRPGAGLQEAGQQLRAVSARQKAVHSRRRGTQKYVTFSDS